MGDIPNSTKNIKGEIEDREKRYVSSEQMKYVPFQELLDGLKGLEYIL